MSMRLCSRATRIRLVPTSSSYSFWRATCSAPSPVTFNQVFSPPIIKANTVPIPSPLNSCRGFSAIAHVQSGFHSRIKLWVLLGSTTSLSLWIFLTTPILELDAQADSESGQDALDKLKPENLAAQISHLKHRPTHNLLRDYITFLLSEIPALTSYGPVILESYMKACEVVPVFGNLGWWIAETIMRHTFFAHYVGGETPEECLPVLKALSAQGIGTILNYSVESPSSEQTLVNQAQADAPAVSNQHIQTILAAVATAANYSPPPPTSPIDGATNTPPVRPTTLAIKLSGLVTDPYVFERASSFMECHGVSAFDCSDLRGDGELFPVASGTGGKDLKSLSIEDRRALKCLMEELRGICTAAKKAHVIVMIDAEYSWFQPALDRLATILSSEFNTTLNPSSRTAKPSSYPIIYNTFQALLRSTPYRIQECLSAADKAGYSVGIKLVRGAYLAAESSPVNGTKEQPRVWPSKEETDICFDSIAGALTSRLADECRGGSTRRTGLVVAGHNIESARKVLLRLRDVEGLAKQVSFHDAYDVDDAEKKVKVVLDEGLRGRLMFAQLYGMADQLTSTLADLLITTSPTPTTATHQYQINGLVPFVHKYLPFGSVREVMPYLARRAEENQSMLQSVEGNAGGATKERRIVGRELRRRIRDGLGLQF